MAQQTYKVEYPNLYWEMKVVIDEDAITTWEKKDKSNYTTSECIKEMVQFWTGWESELEDNEGDYTKTFLQSLGAECCRIIVANGYNLYGLVSEFEDKEGWCKMDGSCGIKIVECDEVNIPNSSFTVSNV